MSPPSVYYNDSEPFVCAWLRNLIAAGLLPAGDVDERPIQEVMPDDVRRYTQAHFFADAGRRAIGIEIEERYCEIAARRLDQTVFALGS